jgi:hypothetical protein
VAVRRLDAVTHDPALVSARARFDALFSSYRRPVLAYAMRRTTTPADAEDATAEAFTIAWRKIDAIPSDEPLPWLYAVARRVLANQRRGRGRRERLAALLRVDDVATPEAAGEDRDGPAFIGFATFNPFAHVVFSGFPTTSAMRYARDWIEIRIRVDDICPPFDKTAEIGNTRPGRRRFFLERRA